MKALTIVLFGGFSAGVVGVACGGVGGQVLFGGAGGGGTGAAEVASSSTGVTSNGGSATGLASSSSSSSTGQGGAASSTVSSSSSSVAASSSSVSSSSSSAASSSSSSGSTPPPVVCDDGTNAACEAGQVCCYNEMPGVPDSCAAPGQCGATYVELSCSGPDDCPGQICCATGTYVGMGQQTYFQYAGISCSSTCPPAGKDGFAVCSGPTDTECGAGKACVASDLLPAGYYVCN
jgi:hypothetical protein